MKSCDAELNNEGVTSTINHVAPDEQAMHGKCAVVATDKTVTDKQSASGGESDDDDALPNLVDTSESEEEGRTYVSGKGASSSFSKNKRVRDLAADRAEHRKRAADRHSNMIRMTHSEIRKSRPAIRGSDQQPDPPELAQFLSLSANTTAPAQTARFFPNGNGHLNRGRGEAVACG